MQSNIKVLIAAKQAENAQTTQYTAVGAKALITKFTATNNSAANASLAINIVTNGNSAGVENLIVTKTIAPGDTYTFPEIVGQTLEPGGFISTIASAATSLTIRASGYEIT